VGAASVSFLAAIDDPALFGPWFTPAWSWHRWRVFAKALFAEPLTPADLNIFTTHTGRATPPSTPAREAWEAIGRRGGKSLFDAALATYMAVCRDYRPYLKPGERALVVVLAADKDQAGVVFDYITGFFDHIPMLAALVEPRGRGRESIRLRNHVTIRVQVASFRRLRGRTVACAILDECAFWYSDETSANPDVEVLKAIRPSLLTIPGSLLVGASTPYARKGILWNAVTRHYGHDDDRVLVWRGDTASMNPSADRQIIAEAYEDDPVAAASEYGGEFRSDLEDFISPEAVAAVVVPGRTLLPVEPGLRHVAFCDPAGGSGSDSMTLAIARREGDTAVLCRVVEWQPPFSPDAATAEAAHVLREYRLSTVTGDAYGGDWPLDRFKAQGIRYVKADSTKSELFLTVLPAINSQRVALLDHPRMLAQLRALERATSRLGRDSISHPPGGHDDLANVMAGALALALAGTARPVARAILPAGVRSIGEPAPQVGAVSQPQHAQRGVVGGQARFVAGWYRSRWYR